jgi:sugar lactone lactonase YvrE
MFFIDTPTISIDAFDYLDGELSNRERLWTVPDESYGYPDGMCIDSQDGLWVAFWNCGKVRRFNAEFEITDEIELSQPLVTSCAFAGENLNTLIITTAHLNKSGRDENWGKTYRAQVLIPGRPTQLFPG